MSFVKKKDLINLFYRIKNDKEKLNRFQEEVMNIQLKYQKELEKFERENKELKKQLLLQREKLRGGKFRKIKVF